MIDPNWESIKKNLRSLESSLYSELLQYQTITTTINNNHTHHNTSSIHTLEQQIEGGLSRMSELCDSLYTLLNTSDASLHTSLQYAHNRYIGVLNDFNNDYKKHKQRLQQSSTRQQLLNNSSSVRVGSSSSIYNINDDQLMNESTGLHRSLQITDSLLGAADDTHQSLHRQQSTLNTSRFKLSSLNTTFPSINKLMSRITLYKHRDNIILAVLVASLIVFTLWYWSNKG